MVNCPNDDTGSCCGKCHFNPVVVIATHNRVEVTKKNIEHLQNQRCKIVLVVSREDEEQYFKNLFPEIIVTLFSNNPLGAKWQHGVDEARKLNADPMIIVGSDDYLSSDYIDRCLNHILKGWELIGTTHWHTYNPNYDLLYKMRYTNQNISFPIGSGKCFSKSLLDRMRWKVFNGMLSRKLDDQGYNNALRVNARICLDNDLTVLAVKGEWKAMNKLEDYLMSRNIKSVLIEDTTILKEIYNYVL